MSPQDSIPAKQPPSDPRPPRRRGALLGLASAAALGGLGLAWWQRQALEQPELVTPALWSVVLATPQGQNLQLADLRGRPLLINFWATWCPPCIEELPLLSRFY
ncbi:MAG: TlpA family protein disulfide reductase, partial [Betaproteobacteria bacterium]|nr:TlpA family protein disulfide reductase [Betaproteobacteria bacterium]